MRCLLIGCCGKMGNEVVSIANKDFKIVAGVDFQTSNFNFPVFSNIFDINKKVDAIIDFSTCNNRKQFIDYAVKNKIAYGLFATNVSNNDFEMFKTASFSIPVLICENASLGVNAMKLCVETLAKKLGNANVVLTEYHHTSKADSPSGTAKMFENILKTNNVDFSTTSFRVGTEKGFHKLEFFLNDEIVEISHRANSRKIFAIGAVNAITKLTKKPNGLYLNLNDL